MKTIVIVSGYFAPLGSHHIEFFEAAKRLGDELWVIVNNDIQLLNKKSFVIQPEEERRKIVASLAVVDKAWISEDTEEHVAKSIESHIRATRNYYDIVDDIHSLGPQTNRFIFANGGDRKEPNKTEQLICDRYLIHQLFNVGPPKTQSSSDVIERVVRWYKEQQNG